MTSSLSQALRRRVEFNTVKQFSLCYSIVFSLWNAYAGFYLLRQDLEQKRINFRFYLFPWQNPSRSSVGVILKLHFFNIYLTNLRVAGLVSLFKMYLLTFTVKFVAVFGCILNNAGKESFMKLLRKYFVRKATISLFLFLKLLWEPY